MSTIDKEDWTRRYANRLINRAAFPEETAHMMAGDAYDVAMEEADEDMSPEDWADEDISAMVN